MLVLRCTERLLRKRPGPIGPACDPLRSMFGDWHANLVRMGPTPIVVALNDVSLLSVVLPGNNLGRLLTSFRDRVMRHYVRLGMPPDLVASEEAAMRCIQVDRTNSRSVLGSMNDFVFQLRWRFSEGLSLEDADRLEDDLAQTPMSALKYGNPAQVIRAAFGQR